MASSEIVNSGKFSGEKSSFSRTCSLLSQYLKEKGNFGDLSLGLTQKFESKGAVANGTVNLLPIKEESRETRLPAGFEETLRKSDISGKSETETAQMTIFYAGEVMVFDDFPANKVNKIMALAAKTSPVQNHRSSAYAPPFTAQSPVISGNNNQKAITSFAIQDRTRHTQLPVCSGARKNSLTRFLQKRKDRIKEKSPYQSAATDKPADGEAWLGIGPSV